ncbi:unnamed protein product, partial [Ceratitis capitata]
NTERSHQHPSHPPICSTATIAAHRPSALLALAARRHVHNDIAIVQRATCEMPLMHTFRPSRHAQ